MVIVSALIVYVIAYIIDKTRSLKEESTLGNVVVKLENVRKRLVERKLFAVYHLKFAKGSVRVPWTEW